MKLLLVKMSSLGDVLHVLPALTEARARIPGLEVDWVIEEAFGDIPGWHPAVRQTIAVALRRWRKRPLDLWRDGAWGALRARLRSEPYDLILDAQGLLKSAFIARLARGPSAGFDRDSAREPLATWAYEKKIPVSRGQHAVERLRQLFSLALTYPLAAKAPGYGIRVDAQPYFDDPYLVLLPGTSWSSKQWPIPSWIELADRAAGAGFKLCIAWGSDAERQRAVVVADQARSVAVLPRLRLGELAAIIAAARAVVGVDGGPSHLAAALGVPNVAVYGATDPALTGTWGSGSQNLAADYPCAPCLARNCRLVSRQVTTPPCYGTLPSATVWRYLASRVAGRASHRTGARSSVGC